MNLSARAKPPGPDAFQTSPKPPRPRGFTSSYSGNGRAPGMSMMRSSASPAGRGVLVCGWTVSNGSGPGTDDRLGGRLDGSKDGSLAMYRAFPRTGLGCIHHRQPDDRNLPE